MRRLEGRFAALLASAFWLVPVLAVAQERPIAFDVMVCKISDQPGPVDARAGRLDEKLRKEFRYESLEVLKRERLALELNQLGTLTLPNDRALQVRPLSLSDRGVLVAVNVQGILQTDMQIQSGHLVAIGAGHYEDGKLVISLEPHL